MKEEKEMLNVKEIMKAVKFAAVAHSSVQQKRKYTGENYIVHPLAVANTVCKFGGTTAEIVAALLHDVVEDTPVTLDEVRAEFGDEVAEIVDGLTENKGAFKNRAVRKQHYGNAVRYKSRSVQLIKLADIADNVENIVEHDIRFAKTYLPEIELMLNNIHAAPAEMHKFVMDIYLNAREQYEEKKAITQL
jgi:(p)ppGpp synthase/HD superfamily hydrolase